MSNFNTLIGGDSAAQRLIDESKDASAIFRDATWDQVGQNKELTKFLHNSLDQNGSKYGGDTAAMKQDILNTTTMRGASALSSIWDYVEAKTEGQQSKQFHNLLGRIYDTAPNRLVSGNLNDTAQAVGSGLLGGLIDAPLIIAAAPVKAALGIGTVAAKTFGAAALKGAAEGAATSIAKGAATQEAIGSAGSQLIKDMSWRGARKGALDEGLENAVLGGIGDAAQQGAGIERGLQDEYSLGNSALNIVGGGALGAGLGGAMGYVGGRSTGKQLAGGIPMEIAGQADARLKAETDALAASQSQNLDPNFMQLSDAWNASKSNLASATDDVNQFMNNVVAGHTQSRYTPDQIAAIRQALTDFRGSQELSESLKMQANALREQGTPDAIQKALDLEQKATGYESVIKHLDTIDFTEADAIMVNGDINPVLVRGLTALDENLSRAMAPGEEPKATGKAPKAASQNAPGSATASAAPNAPPAAAAVNAAPPAAPAVPTIKTPAGPFDIKTVAENILAQSGPDRVAAPATSTPTASAAPASSAPPGVTPPTAAEVATLAEGKFSEPEKASYANLQGMLSVAGTDLQSVMDKVASLGKTEAAKEIVAASPDGAKLDIAAVQQALTDVTVAVQKHVSAVESAAPVVPAPDAPIAPTSQVDAADVATEQVTEQATEQATEGAEKIAEGAQKVAAGSASINYVATLLEMKAQREKAGAVLDQALNDVNAEYQRNLEAYSGDKSEAKLSKDEKTAIVQAALDKAAEDNPDIAPLLLQLDASKMTSAAGVAKAKLALVELANNAIDLTYARVIGDVLPNPTNISHFETVVNAMLAGVPSGERARIVASYQKMIHNALLDRVAAVGVDVVAKDPLLKDAWAKLAGGFTASDLKDVSAHDIVMDRVKSLPVNSDTGIQIANAIKAVKDFQRQMVATFELSGIPLDANFMRQALEMRALHAVNDELNEVFKTANAEAFKKMDAMRELRERDAGGRVMTRSQNHARNPFYNGIAANPILHRVTMGANEDGDPLFVDMVVSGRRQELGKDGKKTVGGPQSMLSDGISDYLGLLWSHPRKMFSATSAANNAILGASVKAASSALAKMVVGGKKLSGRLNELKGLYKETAANSIAQARFGLILQAVQKREAVGPIVHQATIDKISSLHSPVTPDELYMAELFVAHKESMAANTAVVQAELADVLAKAADLGETGAEQINALVSKLNAFKASNDGNLLNALGQYLPQGVVDSGSRSKGRKGVAEGAEKGTAATEKPNRSPYSAVVTENGNFYPSSQDLSTVKVLPSIGKEFAPAQHITLTKEGEVLLFGEKIGTWSVDATKPPEARKAILQVKGMEGEEINSLSSMSRDTLVKNHKELFEKNMGKLSDAPKSTKTPASIDNALSNTQKQADAMAEIKGETKAKPSELDTRMDGFDLPEGRAIAFKVNGRIEKPGKTQLSMTVREFALYRHVKPEDVQIGTIPDGRMNKAGKLQGGTAQDFMAVNFWPLGTKGIPVDKPLVEAIAAKKANAGMAPEIAKAQRQAISMDEAEKITVSDGQTLRSVAEAFDRDSTLLNFESLGTLDDLTRTLDKLTAQAKIIETLAPHGVKRNNASRRTSFGYLAQNMAAFTEAERMAALDVLRRLDVDHDGLPYSVAGDGDQFSVKTNVISTSDQPSMGGVVPKHFAVMHEVGHWAFMNMLSPSERLVFLQSLGKYYGADGALDVSSITKDMSNVKAIEAATGKKVGDLAKRTNELFAWQFTNWAMDKMVGKAGKAAEDTLWSKVVKVGKNLLRHFLGQKIDKELIPLFERILPSTISARKFSYNAFIDLNTGKLVSPAELPTKQKQAALAMDITEKVDKLRSSLGQQILLPGSSHDVGFVETLRSATNHMFGLLYGKDNGAYLGNGEEYKPSAIVTGLRRKLNPFRTNAKTGASELMVGAVDPREMFSSNDIGKLMQAILDVAPKEVADNVAFEAGVNAKEVEVVIADANLHSQPEALAYYHQQKLHWIKEMPALLKEKGIPLDKVNDLAELKALQEVSAEYGVDYQNALFTAPEKRFVLGDEAQKRALSGMSRKLYDLMGDALDHLETSIRSSYSLGLQRSSRASVEVKLEPSAEKAVAAKVAKVSKARKPAKPKVAPTTEASAAVVAAEEAARSVDNVMDGVPAGAPDHIKALIARIPHRDGDQSSIIGTLAYRIFTWLGGSTQRQMTNADIASITGVYLAPGVKPNALASDTTDAFAALRTTLRSVSEGLTNPKRNIDDLYLLMSRVGSAGMGDRLQQRFQDGAFGLDDIMVVAGQSRKVPPKLKDDMVGMAIWHGLHNRSSGTPLIDNIMREQDVANAISTAQSLIAGLGKTPKAKAALGEAVAATPGRVPTTRYTNGLHHPALARGQVEQQIAGLTVNMRGDILGWLGADVADTDLAKYIGFVKEGEPLRVYASVADMLDAMDEASATLASEIALATRNGDAKALEALMNTAEAMDVPGVIPVFYKSQGKVADDGSEKLSKRPKTVQALIDKAQKLKRTQKDTDVPLVGEMTLRLALDGDDGYSPLAIEQRALDAGASAESATIFSQFWKKWRSGAGLSDQQQGTVAAFHGLQIRSNASRIMKAGGRWLADVIMPVEGTGLESRLMTKMSGMLLPISAALDKIGRPTGAISGALLDRTHWYGKVASEVQRNAYARKHVIPQSEAEGRIVQAIRTNDFSKLSGDEKSLAIEINNHFRKLLIMQNNAGISVGDVTDGTNPHYLPQRFNLEWIGANRDEAITRLAAYFTKDRGGNSSRSVADATKVINDALNREELRGILDGANTTYTQAFGDKLHSRKLHFDAGDWSAAGVGPLFDGNLRSLLTSYTEAAHKRVEWTRSFGVHGHGAATYIDIAANGSEAIKTALMSKAQGMTHVKSAMMESDGLPEAGNVEFTDSLFSAFTTDERVAAKYAAEIVTVLAENNGNEAVKKQLIDALVDRFEKIGGQGVEHFRVRAEWLINGVADFGADGGNLATHEVDFMRRTVGTLGGRPAHTFIANQSARTAAAAVKTFNSVSLLSGTVLSSLPDPVLSLVRSGSMSSWLKGTMKAVKLATNDPAFAAAMQRVGVIMESILNENVGHVNGGVMGRASNAFFNATLLTPWTNTMRQTAALVGFESIKANQVIVQREIAAGNLDSWKYRKSMRYLRQLGLGFLVEADKLDTFEMAVNHPMRDKSMDVEMSCAKVSEAVHRFVSESIFQPNRNDIPLWAQDPIASIFWQFKSYPMMLGRLVRHNFREAVATEGGKYAGDPAGLMYLLTVGAAAGAGTLYAKDHLLGKNQEAEDGDWRSARDRSLSKMAQDFGFKDYQMQNGEVDAFFGAYAQGLLAVGAMGLLADVLYQSAKSVDNGAFGRERIMSQILGPTAGTFYDGLQLVEGATHSLTDDGDSNAKERNAVRKIVKRIPVLGGQDPFAEWVVDATAGESQQ